MCSSSTRTASRSSPLEVTIDRDLSALGDLLNELIPSSHIKIRTVGDRVVLTGSVINPIDASRACEVVTSFLGPLDQDQGAAVPPLAAARP